MDFLGVQLHFTIGRYMFSDFDTDNINDALVAYEAKYSSCISEAFNYLLIDCPYDLYWFDKTAGITTRLLCSSMGSSFTVTLEITFYVAEAYQDGENTTVDASKVTAAQTAKATAEAIVAEYVSYSDEDKLTAYKEEICNLVSYDNSVDDDTAYGDIWQLVYVFDGNEDTKVVCEGYSKAFQYLCDLSTFNDEDTYCYTVSGVMSGGTGEGNHMWNIVCLEGINYLVDVTNSDSGTVGQYGGLFLVCADDATTSNSTGYAFTIGTQTITYAYNSNTLNMFSASYLTLGTSLCSHSAGAAVKENEVAATCTTDGSYDSVVYCTVCNEEISRETVTVPATGHTEGEAVEENEVAATCTTDGSYDEVVYCTVCGEELSRDTVTVSATGHTEGEAVKENEVAATCTEGGSYDSVVYCAVCGEEISRETVTVAAIGHTTEVQNAKNATCIEDGYTGDEVCTVCGETVTTGEVIPATGHTTEIQNAKDATCTEAGYTGDEVCTVCGETVATGEAIPATGHGYEAVVTQPTCTEGGYTTYTCTSCGDSYVADETEATGHITQIQNAKAATCTEDGSTGDTVCTVCGETVTAGEVIPAKGHTTEIQNVKDATCTEDGYTGDEVCTVCSETVTSGEVIPATGHTTEVQNAKEATCTVDGYTGDEVCTVCGETVTTGEVIPAGHITEIQNAKDATCTEDGYTGDEVCTVCGETVTMGEVMPATGHTEGETVVENEVAATCTTDGSYDSVVYCTVCNEEISRETVTVPATGHTEGEAVKEKEVAATCTEDGSYDEVVYCTVCGEEISRKTVTVAATGHTEGEAVRENEVGATCTEEGSYDEVVYCTVCGEEISRETVTVPAAGHTEGEAVKENEVAATCTEEGSYDEVVYCTVCGEEISHDTVTVSATGHTAGEAVKENEAAATCTEDGSYDEVIYCTVCGEEISRETVTVPATGHTAGEAVKENEVAATCTMDGSYDSVVYCTVCNEEISRETVTVAASHTAGEAVKENEIPATCMTEGSYDEVVKCSVCGEELSRTAITTDALGHTWDDGVVTTAATATTDGVMTYTCTVCGATKTEAIPATGSSSGSTTDISIETSSTSSGSSTPTTLSVVINTSIRAVSYQWYSASSSTATGTLIEGATSSSYTPAADTTGTTYYYCVVTTDEGTEIVSDVIPVTVTEESAAQVRPTHPIYSGDYYGETSYKITTSTATATHGSIKISNSYAYAGDTVTITVSPDDGYELDELLVENVRTGKSIKITQKSSTKYTFTMPAAKVTIEATFVEINEEEETKVVPSTPFMDISNSRFKDAIAYVYDAGLMNGITTTTFDPEGTLTRAMVATVLYRLAGEPAVSGTSVYSDVVDGLWYSDAITWATQNGVVNGYGDGTFGPNDPVTREQLATMLYRYASSNGIYVGNTYPLDGFIDGDTVRDYAKTAMEWAVANSVLVSRTTAMLDPGKYATREEVAQALSTLIA